MESKASLEMQLESLNEAELKQVLGRVMLELGDDSDLRVDEDEVEQYLAEQRMLLSEAAAELGIDTLPALSSDVLAKKFLLVVSSLSEENFTIVTGALTETQHRKPNLDGGISAFALGLLVISIAGAILRPKIDYESEVKKGHERRKFTFRIEGVKNIEKVIKAVLPFLGEE